MGKILVPTDGMNDLLRKTASSNRAEAAQATEQFLAHAVEGPLRKGIMSGDILGGVWVSEVCSSRS